MTYSQATVTFQKTSKNLHSRYIQAFLLFIANTTFNETSRLHHSNRFIKFEAQQIRHAQLHPGCRRQIQWQRIFFSTTAYSGLDNIKKEAIDTKATAHTAEQKIQVLKAEKEGIQSLLNSERMEKEWQYRHDVVKLEKDEAQTAYFRDTGHTRAITRKFQDTSLMYRIVMKERKDLEFRIQRLTWYKEDQDGFARGKWREDGGVDMDKKCRSDLYLSNWKPRSSFGNDITLDFTNSKRNFSFRNT